ncbi:uncharacterized protein PV09_06951 [Verruconis gallopava]|uniref:alpha-1,2-Mannosidase n=1 Tax=Verruconis gallopava TaxID=253628 RepID=A0A0D2ARF7_9PEZI|nr:uncharacterized protein PV09_06951 [Verruconis gallopava]KIW01779.1 hypothetical protein PV09_06951 [Verruconis gallopava]
MLLSCAPWTRPWIASVTSQSWMASYVLCALLFLAARVQCMTSEVRDSLRQETRDLFYHGFDNYMKHAFPEDELRPVSCTPLTRDRMNPAHIELNDVLGNYSLTLVDSLSTLAILASSPFEKEQSRALTQFQDGVLNLVEQYGDGTDGPSGEGLRARGFDVDSKVQVFETCIRGVGGLLSAHQFAVGDLPIHGYNATVKTEDGRTGIHWKNGLVYDGQLLRLAKDLAERLLPAFLTPTGLPYPRVNLRHGVPFYANSPLNIDSESGKYLTNVQGNGEITETCSAGAGSLVLEFSTLSRLTGDPRFEDAAKKAFWSVWKYRSSVNLIGSGIDAETGHWVHSTTGIGAGIDSFFEYAFKSSVLLSGLPYNASSESDNSPDAFLQVWHDAHAAIKHHVYRGPTYQHPHYLQVDLFTGALRAFWVDSLSAYYPGLLTLAGELDEAISTHLLYTAIWTRYSALPERWSTASGGIESGLRWWIGRPEFIESTWYIYRATKDPWYLHVGEMALRDIKRRCWTKCGWAGLQDVRNGELMDRQESFFLGETAKYLFLLFDEDHPLNHLDSPFVFTTEGHPLVIPKRLRAANSARSDQPTDSHNSFTPSVAPTCPTPPPVHPLTVSATAARGDIFHAASLARLHLMPTIETLESPLVEFTADHPSISPSDLQSPSNYTYYPWTLPLDLVPPDGQCAPMASRMTFDLSFPTLPDAASGFGALQRVYNGILVNSMSGLRLGMVKESPVNAPMEKMPELDLFRIYAISNVALGRDEKVFLTRNLLNSFNPGDPYFTRIKDVHGVDLIIDVLNAPHAMSRTTADFQISPTNASAPIMAVEGDFEGLDGNLNPGILSSLISNIQSMLSESDFVLAEPSNHAVLSREIIAAALPSGPGAAILPDMQEPLDLAPGATKSPLPWSTIYVLDDELCDHILDPQIVKEHQILVIRRGGCSFSEKLRNIPSFPPSQRALQLVIVVSFAEHDHLEDEIRREHYDTEEPLVQPLLDQQQMTPGGMVRLHPIPLVMVSGGDDAMEKFRRCVGVSVRRRFWFESQGTRIGNLFVV